MAAAEQSNPQYIGWKRKIILFLSGQTVSLFGSSLVQFAIIWYITLSTQSGSTMTIASICAFAPQVVISLFSGVWADRFNRKFLIIAADAMTATATLILAFFFMSGHDELWMIFLVSGIRSVGAGIQMPAVNAFLPQIVPTDKLTRIGGINGSLQSVMFILSPAAAGALLSMSSLESVFFVDVFTATIAIIIMFALKVPAHEKALLKQKGGYFDDLKAGLKYVWSSGFFRAYFIFYAIFFFLIVPAAQLTPLMVSRTFGDEYWRLSATEIAFSAGSVIGGIIISIWGGFKNRMRTIALCCILFGTFTMFVGIVPGFVAFLIMILLTGSSVPFFTTPSMVLLQEQVDPNMQGRVFSLTQIVMTAMMPLGMAFFGPLADQIRIEILMIITGICGALVGVLMLFNKHFKHGLITD
ncbi:MAG: MFS transporter [Christensenella sp.]|uniref:MFS transporter n=1 Tax=Christensenella sp. TaxID=1935934 RepID=UPI002B1FFE2A|nr:MFS transporter [Christensenella sp.]MEA5002286.1 MFS transporter [Christensenella sp.]